MPPGEVPVFDRSSLAAFLRRHGLGADKALGQHFLVSPDAVRAILDAVGDARGVLEIGPGPGILTRPLSHRSQVTAVELDAKMPALLAESAPTALVVQADALKTDLGTLLEALPSPRAMVSNIPYYITGPLLDRFAAQRSRYAVAVVMVQREVADRLLAPAGHPDRGALSVSLQRQFALQRVREVPAAEFLPPPRVDSTILHLVPRPEEPDESDFLRWVHLGFAQRRKTLVNNLHAATRRPKSECEQWLAHADVPILARAQDLTEAQWTRLVSILPR